MAYSAGDPILDDEYNVFVNNSSSPFGYNHFAGPGSTIYGLNQSTISTVSAGDTINAAHWNSLFTGMDNIANHLNRSITASSVSAGDTIAIRSALVADLANLAADVAAGGVNVTALDTTAVGSSSNGATWNSTSTIERSVTFANNNTMRAFFNGGGKIRIDPSCTTGIDGDKDTVFNDLTVTAIGNLDMAAHATTRSGSGETLTTNGLGNGFHDLGTGYTTLIKLTSDNSGYTSNTVEISAKLNAAVGSATVVTIKMVSTDADNDDTYTSPNTSGVPSNPNEAPIMTLALIELSPNDEQGLAADIKSASNAEVSNSAS
tara:strand:- start:15387 stop:16340 length:954 start_codon:yes stop_codon:yes gene_type:complete